MGNERAGLDLNFDDAPVDPVALATKPAKAKPKVDRAAITAVSEASDFPSREAKPVAQTTAVQRRKRKKTSPYDIQKGIRMRSTVRDLFHDLVDTLDLTDAATFERAVLALIEKEGTDEQLVSFNEIVDG